MVEIEEKYKYRQGKDTFVYNKEGESKLVTAEEANDLSKKGWKDSPAAFKQKNTQAE